MDGLYEEEHMQWLISNREPEGLYVPILDEQALRSGVVRELIKLLPWFKRTPHMEVMLGSSLATVLRSGFERTFIIKQMESLDIPADVSERFLHMLEEQDICHFGQARYFYHQVLQAAPYEKGVVVRSRYLKSNVLTSTTLYNCLQLLDGAMSREDYLKALEDYLGSSDYAEKACEALGRQGLLLCCNSLQTTVRDNGPLRWNLDLLKDGQLLDAADWDARLHFLEESFDAFFFQSRHHFPVVPLQLLGDFSSVVEKASPAYFWNLSFKLQSFSTQVPVNLTCSSPRQLRLAEWRELGLQSSQIFNWKLMLDLQHNTTEKVQELLELFNGQPSSGDMLISILLDREVPDELSLLAERVHLKFYFTDCLKIINKTATHQNLSSPAQHSLGAYLRKEGCGPTLSPYIDGRGDVYTCSLEGGIHMGHLSDGAQTIERRRQEIRAKYSGACRFGLNPDCAAERKSIQQFVQDHPEIKVRDVNELDFYCP
jgi:hypothetical protein